MPESFVTNTRDKAAALKFLRNALKRHGSTEAIVTDRPASYGADLKAIGSVDTLEMRRWLNNRVENRHQPFRRPEQAMLRFRRMRSLQNFAPFHGYTHNRFNQERNLTSRAIYKDHSDAALTSLLALGGARTKTGLGQDPRYS